MNALDRLDQVAAPPAVGPPYNRPPAICPPWPQAQPIERFAIVVAAFKYVSQASGGELTLSAWTKDLGYADVVQVKACDAWESEEPITGAPAFYLWLPGVDAWTAMEFGIDGSAASRIGVRHLNPYLGTPGARFTVVSWIPNGLHLPAGYVFPEGHVIGGVELGGGLPVHPNILKGRIAMDWFCMTEPDDLFLYKTGWKICNGQTVNGITTPDLRECFFAGYKAGGDFPWGASAAVAMGGPDTTWNADVGNGPVASNKHVHSAPLPPRWCFNKIMWVGLGY